MQLSLWTLEERMYTARDAEFVFKNATWIDHPGGQMLLSSLRGLKCYSSLFNKERGFLAPRRSRGCCL